LDKKIEAEFELMIMFMVSLAMAVFSIMGCGVCVILVADYRKQHKVIKGLIRESNEEERRRDDLSRESRIETACAEYEEALRGAAIMEELEGK